MKVRTVSANSVIPHVNAHHRRRQCYCKHVEPSLDVGRGAVLLDKFIEVIDWTTVHLAIGEPIHDSILVEFIGEAYDVDAE